VSDNGFKYILRCTIEPGFHDQSRLAALLVFCQSARIDDVMFFTNCEELNDGHPTIEETEPWLRLIGQAKSLLAQIGVTTSLNPWTTLLHCDRGRRLKPGQNFTRMGDHTGRKAGAVACPICPKWREYIKEIYAYYATIEPEMVWVEDDFRFHNHEPLTWVGCFCDLHMARFGKRIGRKVSRKSFFKGIVRPGTPHPYRKVWLNINGHTTSELARLIEQAVHEVSPRTQIGLMSSIPSVHCAEGRDWTKLMSNLAGGTEKIDRPHLPAYVETTPGQYLWNFAGVSPYTQAVLPADTILYPELDNFAPVNARFSKSHRFARFQIILAATMGIKGITLNIFDMMGNGPNLEEGIQRMLSESKDFFNRITGLDFSLQNQRGINVLIDTKASYNIHTPKGESMEELYPREVFWSQLLSCLGIANVITEQSAVENGVAAVSGQYFRNISKKAVRDLFNNNVVMLDGEAAETLCQIGLGRLAGIKSTAWLEHDTGQCSYEQVVGDEKYCGITAPRISAQWAAGDALRIEYNGPAEHRTLLKDQLGRSVGPGMTIYDGRVLIFPYGHVPDFPVPHLSPFRQTLLKAILKEIAPDGYPLTFTLDNPYLPVYRYELADKLVLMVVNAALDPVDRLRIHLPGCRLNSARIIDSQTGREQRARLARDGDVYSVEGTLEALEAKVLIFRKQVNSNNT